MLSTMMIAAEGHDSPSVMLPAWPDLIWGTVCFIIIAVAVGKALPRFNKVLDERSAKISEGLALADKAKSDKKHAEIEAAQIVEAARREAAQIREQAQSEAKAIVAQARTEAAGEAGKAMDAAQRQIKADKQAAQISLRSEVGLLATSLAEKIVGEHLSDSAASSRVIDRFLDELEQAPADAGAVVSGEGAR